MRSPTSTSHRLPLVLQFKCESPFLFRIIHAKFGPIWLRSLFCRRKKNVKQIERQGTRYKKASSFSLQLAFGQVR
jgi:hypothetical protein